MKKPCPNLVALDDEQLIEFWKTHRPADLKNLGDRLLAESLPRFEARPTSFYPTNLAEERDKTKLSLEQMASLLSTNPSVVQAWESGEVRAPASLALIYGALAAKA